mmetsp:Transcript_2647/g.10259  ORF Transcript_2647/g.10259 Transcript_2647/m.10259 type:complete len:226 (+) Transcript_2647:2601-3278(+)
MSTFRPCGGPSVSASWSAAERCCAWRSGSRSVRPGQLRGSKCSCRRRAFSSRRRRSLWRRCCSWFSMPRDVWAPLPGASCCRASRPHRRGPRRRCRSAAGPSWCSAFRPRGRRGPSPRAPFGPARAPCVRLRGGPAASTRPCRPPLSSRCPRWLRRGHRPQPHSRRRAWTTAPSLVGGRAQKCHCTPPPCRGSLTSPPRPSVELRPLARVCARAGGSGAAYRGAS